MVDVLTDSQLDSLTELYIAYFCRAPENDGLSFHTDKVLEQLNGTPPKTFEEALAERANQFYNDAVAQPEFTGYSTSLTAEEFVTKLYANVLAREDGGVGGPAPTAAEVGFWVAKIEGGELTRGEVVQRFLSDQDILAASGTAAEQALAADALALFENRVEVAREFALPENSAGLTGAQAFAEGKAALALVTPDPATVPLAIATFSGVGDVFQLTGGVDNIVGTVDDDTIIAGQSETSFINTLGTADLIDGNDGFDTLHIIDEVGDLLTPNMMNVERVNIQALGPNVQVDFTNTTGAEQIWDFNSVDDGGFPIDVTATNIQEEATIGMEGSNGGFSANFADGIDFGGDMNLAVNGAGQEDDRATLIVATDDADNLTTLNIDASGDASFVDVDVDDTAGPGGNTADFETLNITGDADLDLGPSPFGAGSEFNDLTKVDSTGSTGNVTVDLSGNNEDIMVTDGDGDSKFIFDDDQFDENDVVDGGDGTDRIEVQFDNADLTDGGANEDVVDGANAASNVEILVLNMNGGDDIDLDANLFTSINSFEFFDGGPGQGDLDGPINIFDVEDDDTFTFIEDTDDTVTISAATGAGVLNANFEANGDNELVLNDFDTVNINLVDLDGGPGFGADTDASEGTEILLTGAARDVDVSLGNEDEQTLDASGVNTEGDKDDVANVLQGGAGSDTIIGTEQDDIIDADNPAVGVPQQTTVNLSGPHNEGDVYELTINGTTVTYIAEEGDGNDAVENGLVAAINANGVLAAAGITAAHPGANLVITGNADGTPFTVAGDATNAVGQQQITLLDFDSVPFDAGDSVVIEIDPEGALAYTVTVPIAADQSASDTADDVAAAINAAAGSIANGITVLSSGGTLTVEGNPNGTDFAIDLNTGGATDGVANIAATPDIEEYSFSGFGLGDIGDTATVTVNGVSLDYIVSSPFNAVNEIEVANSINANATLQGQNVSAAIVGGDLQITDLDGNDITFSLSGPGSAAFTQVQVGDVVETNALGQSTTQDGIPVGASPNGPGQFSIVDTQDAVAQVLANSDTMTGNGGDDCFIVETVDISALLPSDAEAAMDEITDFGNGDDTIDFSFAGLGAGTADNYAEVVAAGNFAGALAQANSAFAADAALDYAAVELNGDVYLFGEANGDTTSDQVVKLTGVTLADLDDDGSFIV